MTTLDELVDYVLLLAPERVDDWDDVLSRLERTFPDVDFGDQMDDPRIRRLQRAVRRARREL